MVEPLLKIRPWRVPAVSGSSQRRPPLRTLRCGESHDGGASCHDGSKCRLKPVLRSGNAVMLSPN
jgi:hypothetical protein